MRTLQGQLRDKGLSDSAERTGEQGEDKTPVRLKERLSEWEIADLMGSTRATFRRGKGGAIRRNR